MGGLDDAARRCAVARNKALFGRSGGDKLGDISCHNVTHHYCCRCCSSFGGHGGVWGVCQRDLSTQSEFRIVSWWA